MPRFVETGQCPVSTLRTLRNISCKKLKNVYILNLNQYGSTKNAIL